MIRALDGRSWALVAGSSVFFEHVQAGSLIQAMFVPLVSFSRSREDHGLDRCFFEVPPAFTFCAGSPPEVQPDVPPLLVSILDA